jgi:inorganic triphosphatase YgiF
MPAKLISQFLRVAVVAATLVGAACQTAPVQEMSDARQAITVATKAGAEQHAADLLHTAVSHLQSAERLLNERKYSQARHDALSAKHSALEALRSTETSIAVEAH